jgi:hypothetical protein
MIKAKISTAGGKIHCLRCNAKSKRTGHQCGKPALKSSKTQKCQFHGGRSTGPTTDAGKARQKAAVTTTGQFTKDAIERRACSMRILGGIEDVMHLLDLTSAPRTRGRKPLGYMPINTIEGVIQFVIDSEANRLKGSSSDQ